MTVSRDLFLSILSMDSYNRGDLAGIKSLGETGPLGNATIRAFGEDDKVGWQAGGFYAIAYNWNGEKVITYRGSDETRAQDIILGYPLAVGWPLSAQGNLAITFARAVAGGTVPPIGATNITVTGHSLGHAQPA